MPVAQRLDAGLKLIQVFFPMPRLGEPARRKTRGGADGGAVLRSGMTKA